MNNVRWYVVGKLRSLAIDDPHCEFYVNEFVDTYHGFEYPQALESMKYVRSIARRKHEEIMELEMFPKVLEGKWEVIFCPVCGNQMKESEGVVQPIQFHEYKYMGIICKGCAKDECSF